ncbi:hypothetical protein A2U01_0072424, partial [Trifolium medium]|nr:hypothetical protein [Trifolium medium]
MLTENLFSTNCPMIIRLQFISGTYNTSSMMTLPPFLLLATMLPLPSAASFLLSASFMLVFLLASKL